MSSPADVTPGPRWNHKSLLLEYGAGCCVPVAQAMWMIMVMLMTICCLGSCIFIFLICLRGYYFAQLKADEEMLQNLVEFEERERRNFNARRPRLGFSQRRGDSQEIESGGSPKDTPRTSGKIDVQPRSSG